MIISIGRQHGSGGREIARLLARELGIKCYDKEIVDEAAKHSDFSRDLINAYDEKRMNAFMLHAGGYGLNENFRLNMQVVSAQFDAIREIASKGDCIFVGRCADYILRERSDLVSVFILGDMDERLKCLERRQGLDEAAARKKIKEVDKDRSSFYKYYSDQVWGDAQNYDLCINSSRLGVEGTVKVIMDYIKARGLI
ncbi:MAG: cytidylate kinase-like family protein [Oscillospiraceae bacterium]|jgi:cytidylate kinase|nr:cytidylate kinase-like family protein [Oscillospiraceae bacterium]